MFRKESGYGLLFLSAITLTMCVTLGCEGPPDAASNAHDGHPDDAALLKPGEIEIIIDSMGVPHVYGGTDADVFFGYGYQVAHDRLFQLEMFRRQALGRSAEVIGQAGVLRDQQARSHAQARDHAVNDNIIIVVAVAGRRRTQIPVLLTRPRRWTCTRSAASSCSMSVRR